MANGASRDRVLATFFLMTYNQEAYVRAALEGAFSQTYSPLEIVVSDDCSTDGTFGIIEEICGSYRGPHKVVVNRNSRNLGLIGHINRITSLASGELIIYAAGDDISLPHRTSCQVERYLASGRQASLIHSSVILIDNDDNRLGERLPPVVEHDMDLMDMALSGALVIGATSAFTRKLEETFGPIKYQKCIEDLVMGFRSALTGGLECIDEPLLLYRHESGITARSDIRTQTYAQYLQREIRNQEIFLAVLSQRRDDLRRINEMELNPVIQRKRAEALLQRTVWAGGESLLRITAYAARKGLVVVMIKALFREKKWRTFFPLKKMLAMRSASR